MQPQLFAEDWSVPARTPFELSSADGVAIVTKAQVANVIRHVGYARNSVGIVTTQSASQLYLKGYPCQEFYARIKVRTDDDVEKEHHVQETHDKMFAKLPAFCGWTNEGMKGSTLSNLIQFTCTTCELHAIEGLKTRQDSTATVLVRESCVPDLMKASGRDGHLPVDECLSLADDHLTSCEKKAETEVRHSFISNDDIEAFTKSRDIPSYEGVAEPPTHG